MWWDMAAEMRADFEDWHAHETLAAHGAEAAPVCGLYTMAYSATPGAVG